MKYAKQFALILLVSFLGEGIRLILPFPIPGSVYGMVLMLAALEFRIIKLDQVKATGDFLIEIMPLMFIPAGVGLLAIWTDLRPVVVPVLLITFLTTVIVMVLTGRITQVLIREEEVEGKTDESLS